MGVHLQNAGQWAMRIGVCQILGTFSGLVGQWALSRVLWPSYSRPVLGSWLSDMSLVLLGGLFFGIPFYGMALWLFREARASILKWPAIWCLVVPSVFLVATLTAFPPGELKGIIWIALIPLCALFAGILFYSWLRISPMEA
jgi:hypothetical protein